MNKNNSGLSDADIREIIECFIAETYDIMDTIEPLIGQITQKDNKETIYALFRAFHSLKGSSGYINLENIKSLTHTTETMLDLFRKDKIKPTEDHVDVLYQVFDHLQQLLKYVEKFKHDNSTEIKIDNIVQIIKSSIDQTDERISASDHNNKDTNPVEQEIITPEVIDQFIAEANDLANSTETSLLQLEKETANKEIVIEIFRCIHTLKGNCGLMGFNNIEKKLIEMEDFLSSIRDNIKLVNGNVISYLLKNLDLVREKINQIKSVNKDSKQKKSDESKQLGEILVDMGAIDKKDVNRALELQQRSIGEILVDTHKVKQSEVKKAMDIQKKQDNETFGAYTVSRRKEIRVNTSKLDDLFNLTGEMITAEAMVSHHPDLETVGTESLKKSTSYLSKITRDLQEITMSIRMIPLEGLFNKMLRLVRDLSRKKKKHVELKISGSETEMDRKIIEEISDPLIHIIRNGIDHGIESEEIRLKNNKSKIGCINLNAQYEGNEIWISIKDDGAGLDKNKILEKAKKKGLIAKEETELSDDQVYKLIFEPGFSTAQKVTDISGRGVGMDVVKKNIEKLRGQIDIKSKNGKGTEILLKIPLTLAIFSATLTRVANNLYAIPIYSTREYLVWQDEKITQAQGEDMIRIRDDIIPIINLYEYFKLPKQNINKNKLLILVENNKKQACLLVDEIIGYQQVVVKPFTNYIHNPRGLLGCSILGNGEISLIIDVGKIIDEELD